MREILFRGIRKDDNKWVHGHYDFISYMHYIYHYEPSELKYVLSEVIDETVEQFTGLPDKNDCMIFEGDIVLYRDKNIGIVSFADGAFGVKFKDGTSAMFLCFAAEYCEVIGNIHDNPELLG